MLDELAIYEKVLKAHYTTILYIDFEKDAKCTILHTDSSLENVKNVFPTFNHQSWDAYVESVILKYSVSDVKENLSMASILEGTSKHRIHHVMINFILNQEMRFMQFDFTRESENSKNVLLFVEDYTTPQQQAFVTTLETIQNSACLFLVEQRNLIPIFVSQGFADMMQTTVEDLFMNQSQCIEETIHFDDLEYVENAMNKMSVDYPHVSLYYRKKNPKGKWFDVHSDISYIIIGKKEYLYVTYQDVGVIKKNQQLMELNTKVLDALGSVFMRNVLVHLDTMKTEWIKLPKEEHVALADVNESWQIRDIVAEQYVCEEYKQGYLEFTNLNTLNERLKNQRMIRYIYKNHENQWININAIPQRFDENGNLKDVLFATREVTEEREKELSQEYALKDALEAAKHANKAKTTFLNNMSHDIRTPMNAIIGFTALAATHMDQPELVKDYLSKIKTSSSHLLSLINDILDMSRIESGSVKIDENEVSIPDVLHDLKTIIQGNIQAKQHDLYIGTQDVVHESVHTDRLRLNQVLLNIVGNAIKFTPVGGTIRIKVLEKPCCLKGYSTFEFRIKDNGIGMSKDFQKHIFDSFSRERTSTKSGISGTGLGMAITKNIVDMMGGTIALKSEENKGTEFVVTFDFKTADASISYAPILELENARALIVDDDIDTCTNLNKMLREIGMRADWCTSGKEAVIRAKEALYQNEEFKAYIIDWLMPDMNGIETVRRIRDVIQNETPIIILTAYDYAEIEQEAIDAGVTAFMEKPIFMSELRKVLSKPVFKTSCEDMKKDMRYAGCKVLLVEDNELNQEIATAILEEVGIIVDTVNDGTDAVERMFEVNEDAYDLIFMDIQMPKMDGYTATREIRTMKNHKKANIPIIAMTANAFEEDRKLSFQSGMNAHIAKPIDIGCVLEAMDEVEIGL